MKKIILLVLICFTSLTSSAAYWYYANVILKCYPEKAGNVIVGFNTNTDVTNPNICKPAPAQFNCRSGASSVPFKFNTFSTDVNKYEFDHWEDENGKTVSTKALFQRTVYTKGFLNILKGEFVEGLAPNSSKNDASGNPGTITHTYTAVYKTIASQYIYYKSENNDVMNVKIDKPTHNFGDMITLTAYTLDYNTKFIGWEKDGVIVSRERILPITVSEETQGEYIARCSTGHSFFRIINKGTSRNINAINDVGSISDFSSLSLCNSLTAFFSPGSIFNIDTHRNSGGTAYYYTVQGVNTRDFYDEPNGIYVTAVHYDEDNAWNIQANRADYMADTDLSKNYIQTYPIKSADVSHWYYEPMDKDLTTKENYFTFDPEKLLFDETTGKYYTTLRTAWNVLFDTNEIKAYIVTGVDEDGILIKTEVTGGIIPKNTCVLIECNSNDTNRNVMVPTNTAASFTATSGNILVSSTKYFPNQDADSVASNCKALTLIDGAVGFGGDACSKINGNDAYMCRDDDVFVAGPEEAVLGAVIENETTNKKYDVTDLTCVMAVPSDDGSAVLYCKDENGYATPDMKGADEKDYILDIAGGALQLSRDNHDQSNWVALYAPATLFPATPQSAPSMKAEQGVTNAMVLDLKEQKINNVVGTVTDLKNPSLTLKALPAIKEQNAYSYNTYVPANFYGSQKGYFFISPKPMEIAQIRWAVWAGDHFEGVPKTATTNSAGLEGAFGVNWSLMGGMPEDITVNHIYDFLGLIKLESPVTSQAAGAMAVAPNYVVYPFGLEDVGEVVNGVVTGINNLNGNAAVKSVKYYNLLGVGSDTPHQGVNIVVSTMNDGTTVTSKRVF